jgi:hypothetical protein
VASADFNSDGFDDIITGAGPGGGPHVEVFSGKDGSKLASFYAFDPNFAGGVYVSAGDLDGDGKAEIITGAGGGSIGSRVSVFAGGSAAQLATFFAYASSFPGGVRVGTVDVDRDGRKEIVTGAGPGGGPHVRVFRYPSLQEYEGFYAFDPTFGGGIFVAGQ